jgi:hypothetical protein
LRPIHDYETGGRITRIYCNTPLIFFFGFLAEENSKTLVIPANSLD